MTDADPAALGAAVRQLLGDSLGYLYPAALRAAVRAGVADHLATGPLPPEKLAELGGVQADHLRRVLRFLATRGVFREREGGDFELTTAAVLLRSDAALSLRPLVLLFTDPLCWLPTGRLEDTVRTGEAVFGEVFGSQFFDHLLTDGATNTLFCEAMATLSTIEQGPIVDSYPFPERGTVVDIGGGLGGLLHTVLARNPGLTGILLDREPVVSAARLDDPAVAGRWEAQAADFYAEIPAGADVYLLKRILHDKTDADCVRLLRACRRAMPAAARLLIIDPLIPVSGACPDSTRLSDVLMMAVFEGRERTEADLAELLGEAGLAVNQVVPTPGALTILEAVPVKGGDARPR
ncbi:methyltransferase [Actinomadura sp. NEAU-AAG7]|uniref:methyltransferase n=1 Tax=Actinomadura sp. NEAU-AAG7 TaxID=2839640 RepID=UPI001BE4D274|nr:methyltransferase [Actinomadura sp. NEAU-AAG7]MBT2208107.1 hypothetical protein [Actinomadura sp. NEAU-AAG7]